MRRRRNLRPSKKEDALSEIQKIVSDAMTWLVDDWPEVTKTGIIALGLALLKEHQSEFINIIEPERVYQHEYWKWEGHMRDYYRRNIAKLWIDHSKGILCARFPFNQVVIDEIKARIPKGKKEWSPQDGVWHFSVEVAEEITDILFRNFADVIDLTKEATPVTVVTKDSLLAILPKEDQKEIYRMLAKKYHPDRNPNGHQMMAKINTIFKEV